MLEGFVLSAQISHTELEMNPFFYCLMSRNLKFCMNTGRFMVCLSAHSCVLIALPEWRPVHPPQQVSLQSRVERTRLLQVIRDDTKNSKQTRASAPDKIFTDQKPERCFFFSWQEKEIILSLLKTPLSSM